MANILAVDDEKAVLTLIKNILQMDHHAVTAISDPEKIFELQLGRFDLILLDVMMPNVDGFTLCRKIRDKVDCPILFLTAKTMEKERRKQISALAHDIKTPLTVVRGNTDLLLKTNQTEEQKEYTAFIQESTRQMEQYIKTLIEISKAEMGYILNKQPVNSKLFIDSMYNQISALAAFKKLSIDFHTRNLPEFFDADRDLLQRAVMNIASNAVDYSLENAKIDFSVEAIGDKIYFCIIDCGKGFSPDALKNATQQFYMADKSRTSKAHYGMGLFITKSIVEQHGGVLLLENSKETGGGKATVVIPV